MNHNNSIRPVKVPAASANLGPGFDCMAIVLDLYKEVSLCTGAKGVIVTVSSKGAHSHYKTNKNFIAHVSIQVFKKARISNPAFALNSIF